MASGRVWASARDVVAVENPRSYPHLNTLAAILVRAARYDDALKQFDAAIAAHGKGGTALDWLFQALALQALGKQERANELADKAAEWIKQLEAGELKSDDFKYPLSWSDRAQFVALLREVRSRHPR